LLSGNLFLLRLCRYSIQSSLATLASQPYLPKMCSGDTFQKCTLIEQMEGDQIPRDTNLPINTESISFRWSPVQSKKRKERSR
jgi:hypothetical protein